MSLKILIVRWLEGAFRALVLLIKTIYQDFTFQRKYVVSAG